MPHWPMSQKLTSQDIFRSIDLIFAGTSTREISLITQASIGGSGKARLARSGPSASPSPIGNGKCFTSVPSGGLAKSETSVVMTHCCLHCRNRFKIVFQQ
ncbi:hypothetical protein PGTUg99_006342 [Puccinia graminis f. sp. tritici]|uniref:Uncharacterized protein n=1 Tax=Puccinia graminis f. sp. tritici TaxID=56615 RepID=A0A5B0SL96_PUCGR|nr:hypothetical protein PGTUg99_006342 [Puccinia graminis f. sp. tritici]